jgi:hypothetical protein
MGSSQSDDHESLHQALRCHFLVCCSVCRVYSLCLLHVYYVFEHLIGSVSGALSSNMLIMSISHCQEFIYYYIQVLDDSTFVIGQIHNCFRRIYQNDYCHVKSSFYFILTF